MDVVEREGGRPVWFVGDLSDPWVVAIADALPGVEARIDAPGDLPAAFEPPAYAVLVIHRAVLTRHDADLVAGLRSGRDSPARVVLCFGPHVRHADLERWGPLVDAAVPEATARETLAGHLTPTGGANDPAGLVSGRRSRPGRRGPIAVVSTNLALGQAVVEACELLGFAASPARDWSDAPPSGPAVWDVPWLEPDWSEVLARRARCGPVVALLGFADRALVAEARSRGAVACLDLPFDLADLAGALDQLPEVRAEPAHDLPPPPTRRRLAPLKAVAESARDA